MTRFATLALTALAVAGSAILPGGIARAADLAPIYGEQTGIAQDAGLCNQSWVFRAITHRFRHQVTHVPHLPNVSITNFYGVYQRRYLPAYEDRPIGRSYCGATVALSDGDRREIWYLIEEGQGFASMGDNVEFCVSGFDRWYVYNGRCRVLRYEDVVY
jgi:capsid protein